MLSDKAVPLAPLVALCPTREQGLERRQGNRPVLGMGDVDRLQADQLVLAWSTPYGRGTASPGDFAVVTDGRSVSPTEYPQQIDGRRKLIVNFPSALAVHPGTLLVVTPGAVSAEGRRIAAAGSVWTYGHGTWAEVSDGTEVPQYPTLLPMAPASP